MEAIGLGVVAGLVVGIAVYVIQERRRNGLVIELRSLRETAAMSAARVEELQRYAGDQAQHLTNAYVEREALLADSEGLRRKIQERDNENDDVLQPD